MCLEKAAPVSSKDSVWPVPPAWAGPMCEPSRAARGRRRDAGLPPPPPAGACQLPGLLCCRMGRAASLFLEEACWDLGVVVGEHELRVRASYSHPIPMQVKTRR